MWVGSLLMSSRSTFPDHRLLFANFYKNCSKKEQTETLCVQSVQRQVKYFEIDCISLSFYSVCRGWLCRYSVQRTLQFISYAMTLFISFLFTFWLLYLTNSSSYSNNLSISLKFSFSMMEYLHYFAIFFHYSMNLITFYNS